MRGVNSSRCPRQLHETTAQQALQDVEVPKKMNVSVQIAHLRSEIIGSQQDRRSFWEVLQGSDCREAYNLHAHARKVGSHASDNDWGREIPSLSRLGQESILLAELNTVAMFARYEQKAHAQNMSSDAGQSPKHSYFSSRNARYVVVLGWFWTSTGRQS